MGKSHDHCSGDVPLFADQRSHYSQSVEGWKWNHTTFISLFCNKAVPEKKGIDFHWWNLCKQISPSLGHWWKGIPRYFQGVFKNQLMLWGLTLSGYIHPVLPGSRHEWHEKKKFREKSCSFSSHTIPAWKPLAQTNESNLCMYIKNIVWNSHL